jgi:N-dimethylarginine dimethylaminohydrolase
VAKKQWENLFITLSLFAEIEILTPQPYLPDMVFTANVGLVKENVFIPSHFQYPERRLEEIHFRKWLSKQGCLLADLAGPVSFEKAKAMPCFNPAKTCYGWVMVFEQNYDQSTL